jgi:hypothetical protein
VFSGRLAGDWATSAGAPPSKIGIDLHLDLTGPGLRAGLMDALREASERMGNHCGRTEFVFDDAASPTRATVVCDDADAGSVAGFDGPPVLVFLHAVLLRCSPNLD